MIGPDQRARDVLRRALIQAGVAAARSGDGRLLEAARRFADLRVKG